MPRRVRSDSLEHRTARLKLPVRRKPYCFTVVSRGIALGYRANRHVGSWVVRAADGHGGYWTKAIGFADDHEEADGKRVLDWWQAQDRARTLVRGGDGDSDRPVTVAEAIDAYERDLAARGGDPANAHDARRLLPAGLLARPVGLLKATELRSWRDSLLATRKPSSVNRRIKGVKAAFNLARAHDPRIASSSAWEIGLASLPDAHAARHIALSTDAVRSLVTAAYALDPKFGLWVETAAVTGARASQINRLDVGDLQDGRPDPRLLMPSSRKGRGRKRVDRKPVPIPQSLAIKLRRLSTGASDDPLLAPRWPDGGHIKAFRRVAASAGLPGTTSYALRHSSIIRMLLANVPTRVVASLHDTSVVMIERTYAAYIADHADTVARAALLDLDRPQVLD
jgi:integrase